MPWRYMTGQKHESCTLLKHIEHLEKKMIGEYNDTAGPKSKRIKALEKLFIMWKASCEIICDVIGYVIGKYQSFFHRNTSVSLLVGFEV